MPLIFILYFSLSPGFKPMETKLGRKGDIEHFTAYMIYALLLERTMKFRPVSRKHRRFAIAVLLASALGGTAEILQGYVPYRVSDPIDWIIDTSGAIIGISLMLPLIQKIYRRIENLINIDTIHKVRLINT